MEHVPAVIWDWMKWLVAAVVGGALWLYRSDRGEMKSKLDKHTTEIAALEESRPRRSEMVEGMKDLRSELREDNRLLREEVRVDLAELRTAVTVRLDSLIEQHKKANKL